MANLRVVQVEQTVVRTGSGAAVAVRVQEVQIGVRGSGNPAIRDSGDGVIPTPPLQSQGIYQEDGKADQNTMGRA